jgi:aspartokinase
MRKKVVKFGGSSLAQSSLKKWERSSAPMKDADM